MSKKKGINFEVKFFLELNAPTVYPSICPGHERTQGPATLGTGPGSRSNNHKTLAVKSIIHVFFQSREQTATLYWPRLHSQSGSATGPGCYRLLRSLYISPPMLLSVFYSLPTWAAWERSLRAQHGRRFSPPSPTNTVRVPNAIWARVRLSPRA